MRAVARDAAELPESALLVAGHLDPDLKVDLGAVFARLRLVDGTATDGVPVVGALLVVSEVDLRHHDAVAPDIRLDEVVGAGVVAVLTALVHEAFLAEDLPRCLLGRQLFGGSEALSVGASDLGESGENSGILLGGLVRPQLAHLLLVHSARGTVGLLGLSVGTALLLEGSAAGLPVGLDSRPGVEGRDGLVLAWLVGERDLSRFDGSSISWHSAASERERFGSNGRLLGREDGLGHPGYPQNRVGDLAAVNHLVAHLSDIPAEIASAVVVFVGTHGRDWLGVVGMCVGRVCGWDE